MNRDELIEKFLKKMAVAAKQNINITNDTVYNNLIKIGVTRRHNINSYFKKWIDEFKDVPNINVFVQEDWTYFCQFTNIKRPTNRKQEIKLYIPIDYEHIHDSAVKIFNFSAQNNIAHLSKIGSDVRMDDIVIRLFNINDMLMIENFIMHDENILKGVMQVNPFTYTNGVLSYAWDGNLSFNSVLSAYISGYINYLKSRNNLNNVSYGGLYNYIKLVLNNLEAIDLEEKYKMVFDPDFSYNINDFQKVSKMLCDIYECPNKDMQDFYNCYSRLNFMGRVNRLVKVQKTWDEIYKLMIMKDGAKANKRIVGYILTGNYNCFTRENNIRDMVISNDIDQKLLIQLISNNADIRFKEAVLENSCLFINQKYGYNQVKTAIIMAKSGKYNNIDQANIIKYIDKDEIEAIVIYTLLKNGYMPNDIILKKDSLIDEYLGIIIKEKGMKK